MKRTWQLLMQDQRARAYESVKVEHPTLAEALRIAVEEAERRGWAG